jgi:hypothetical protein
MRALEFIAVTKAFNAIGATNSQGKPYANAHGVSVSADGRRFRFWKDEVIFPDEHTMDLYRPPPRSSTWREGDGKGFYSALVAARDSGISVRTCSRSRDAGPALPDLTSEQDCRVAVEGSRNCREAAEPERFREVHWNTGRSISSHPGSPGRTTTA